MRAAQVKFSPGEGVLESTKLQAIADAITALKSRALSVCSLQDREKRRETVAAELRSPASEQVPT